MTLEEDSIYAAQVALMVAGPILIFKTLDLWRGIWTGGNAKTQAWILFSSDPMTLLSAAVCSGVLLLFWTAFLTSALLARISKQESGFTPSH